MDLNPTKANDKTIIMNPLHCLTVLWIGLPVQHQVKAINISGRKKNLKSIAHLQQSPLKLWLQSPP